MEATFASTSELERGYAVVSGHAFKKDTEFRNRKLQWMKRPGYRPEHTRIIIDNGEVVAGVAIVEMHVRYGDATLKMGGISTVATDPDKQGRGYGRANMEDTVRYMAEDGYDISFLLGIHDYYPKYGYRTALVWAPVVLNVAEAPSQMPEGWTARKIEESDIPALDEVYRKTIGNCDLAVQRTEADWKWYFTFGRFGRANDRVIVNADNKVVGYFTLQGRGDRMRVDELGVLDDVDAYAAVIAAMRDRGKDLFAREVEIYTVPDGGFARWALYRARGKWSRSSDYAGGPMFRLFNAEQLFGKIGRTLAKRWEQAPRNTPEDAVTIRCPLGQVALIPTGEGLRVRSGEESGTVVEMPHEALTELVLGFRPAVDILSDAGVTASESATRVLASVFPVQIPFIPPTDHI
ncbi:MAG TPA: GNAT family N-acetyltransferase [Firmicutes bacterium]|nr:GNAT family N-acetyltransferase [Bacillota bacterium]